MSRFFGYWIVLAPVAVLAAHATSLLMFRQVDLSFAQFATLFVVPIAQAAALAWEVERPGRAIAAVARSVAAHPFAQPIVAVDLLVTGAGLLLWGHHVIGFGARFSIHSAWILVKSAAATIFFAGAVLRADRGRRAGLAVQLLAPILLALALEPSTSWMAAIFSELRDVVGRRAEVLQRLAFYGVIFSIVVGLTLRAAREIERTSVVAARLIRMAVGASVLVAATVVLAMFNLAVLTQPWLGVTLLCASCCASSVLLAGVFSATPSPHETRT